MADRPTGPPWGEILRQPPTTALRSASRAALGSRRALWVACALAHAYVVLLTFRTHDGSFGDVGLYRWWVEQGLDVGRWPVVTEGWEYSTWVYPVLAIVPMLLAAVLGSVLGTEVGWLVVSVGASVGAFAMLVSRTERRAGAWYWLAFLVMLGPISLVRLDVFVASCVLVGLLLAARHPRAAAVVLTLGAWVKVVPAALVWSLFATTARRWRDVVLPAGALTAVVVGTVALLGGGGRSLSFLSEQGERGLQVESVGAGLVMLARGLGIDASVRYNDEIYTYEIAGRAADVVGAALPVVLVLLMLLVAALTWFARRHGRAALSWSALAFLAAAIVGNKVGSPQFQMWLLAPLAVGLAWHPRSAAQRWVAAGGLVAAVATQYTYPYHYGGVVALAPLGVTVLLVRNAVVVGVLVTALLQLAKLARQGDDHR